MNRRSFGLFVVAGLTGCTASGVSDPPSDFVPQFTNETAVERTYEFKLFDRSRDEEHYAVTITVAEGETVDAPDAVAASELPEELMVEIHPRSTGTVTTGPLGLSDRTETLQVTHDRYGDIDWNWD